MSPYFNNPKQNHNTFGIFKVVVTIQTAAVMKKIVLIFLLPILSICSFSQIVTTWQGPSNGGSWGDAANWDNGVPVAATTDIVFDGAVSSLTGGQITITDVVQTNPNFSFNRLRVINNATVSLSGNASTYFYFFISIDIDAGSRVNIGGTGTKLFEIGGQFSTISTINGTLDLQGQGNSSNSANFVPTTTTFGSSGRCTVNGKIILSGLNAKITPNAITPVFEAGSELSIKRDGGSVPKANYKNGSLIHVEGVTGSVPLFNNSSTYEGEIRWNCPQQTTGGSSAIILPSSSFNYIDSLVIISTGSRSVRLATNPSNYYVKNLLVNGGTVELSSPTGSGPYNQRFDALTQNGGTIIGNAPGVAGFDNAFSPDTLSISGNFTQNAGVFDFSTRTPVNTAPNGSFVLQVGGNLLIGGTIRLSQPNFTPGCSFIFNGQGEQRFTVLTGGRFTGSIPVVINNSSSGSGISLQSNVTLPDGLVFRTGYIFLNDFDLTLP